MPDSWCTLCEAERGDTPSSQWWEVKTLGPERRVHAKCFKAVMEQLRTVGPDDFLKSVEAREKELEIVR